MFSLRAFARVLYSLWLGIVILASTGIVYASPVATESGTSLQPDAPGQESPNVVLTTLSLKDGSLVQFQEPMPGEIVIMAQTPVGLRQRSRADMINGVSVQDIESLNSLEIYEALSGGRPPPRALIAAHRRVEAAKSAAPPSLGQHPLQDVLPEPDKAANRAGSGNGQGQVQSSNLQTTSYPVGSGDWFRLYYSPQSDTFCYCNLYRTGDATVTRNLSYIWTAAYPYRGNVTQALEYESCFIWCSWTTSAKQTVLQGYTGWIWAQGSARNRRATIRDAWGDGYHWSGVDQNGIGCLPASLMCSCPAS